MRISLTCISLLLIWSCSGQEKSDNLADPLRINSDLNKIIHGYGYRNYQNTEVLDSVAGYIYHELLLNCDTVYYQNYKIGGKIYRNVIGSKGSYDKPVLIIGAHYDAAGNQPGADDNASGVAGLLELSRLLKSDSLKYRLEYVAYTLEEPPFFKTADMGSYRHASMLKEHKADVAGMICLEMIGFYSDERNSQDFPLRFLRLFYGNKGNFITVVQKFGNGKFGRKVKRRMKKYNLIKTKSFKGPEFLPGIDFSDHANYWKLGYSAVMITNTAFYRNKNYHKTGDALQTLDIQRLSYVISHLYYTVIAL